MTAVSLSSSPAVKWRPISTPAYYGSDPLSEGLPLQVHLAARASASGNVTAKHALPPISAALLAYDFIIADNLREWGSVMTNVTAEMANKTAQADKTPEFTDQNASLNGRYRQIGISAVAAAVRYQGSAKNPAYAPAPTKWQDRAGEAAA